MYYPESKSHRLPDYDYSQPGWYFVTLSTRNMSCLFGSVNNGVINLTDAGRMIENVWRELPRYSSRIDLDIFQVMPNHFHGILIIKEDLEQVPITSVHSGHTDAVKGKPARQGCTKLGQNQTEISLSLLDLIARFKSLTTTQYIRGVKENNWKRFDKKLWGTRFHDHVIRTESALQSIRTYIQNNPRKWELDRLNKRL
jgi:REP element-mobilizing transposase RayT